MPDDDFEIIDTKKYKDLTEPEKITSVERREQQEKIEKKKGSRHTTILYHIAENTDKLVSNMDMLFGFLSYALTAWAASYAATKDIFKALLVGIVAGLTWYIKHRFPAGPATKTIKKPTKELIRDVSETIIGKR